MISREHANEIAEREIQGRAVAANPAVVSKVLAIEEIQFAAPNIYGYPPAELDRYWIVYLHRPSAPWGLRESEVMLIGKADGAVCYWGGAGDEG